MPPYIDLKGASGVVYRFHLADTARPLTPGSGIYLLVASKPDGLLVLDAEEASNLHQDALPRWETACKQHGPLGIYLRLHVARAPRQHELADVRSALTLPS